VNKSPLAVISIFFIIGIILGRFLPDSITLSHVFVVTLILITLTLTLSHKWERGLFWLRGRGGFETRPYSMNRAAHAFLFLSIISLGSLLYLNSNIFPSNHISHFLGKDKVKAEIIGTIKSPAEARGVYYGKISSRYLFEIETVKTQGHNDTKTQENPWLSIHGLALVRIQTEKDYQYGDRLRVKGTIRRPAEIPNPKHQIPNKSQLPNDQNSKPNRSNNFNYREYLERQNIFAIINASEKNVTLLSHNYKSSSLIRFAYFVREKLKNQFLEKMPLESGAFLRAILLGDRSELPKKLNESFRNSGTMHILPIQNTKKLNCPS
jgi:hypothetical protein